MNRSITPKFWVFVGVAAWATLAAAQFDPTVLQRSTNRAVKIYGAGGLGRIEAYGTGFVVAPDGWILTVMSPILDANDIGIVLSDGRRLSGRLAAADPVRGLAMVKVDAVALDYFDVEKAATAQPGDYVLALCNLYNIAAGSEPVSVMHGIVSAVAPLNIRQGIREVQTPGDVYVIDAVINNPGAAGGPVTDASGRLVAMIGKELKSNDTNTWINYAIPASQFAEFVKATREGRALEPTTPAPVKDDLWVRDADLRGIIPLPDVLDQTPAYIDGVAPGSPAEKAGVKADDLVMFVDDQLVQNLAQFRRELARWPAEKPVSLLVLRGGRLVPVTLEPRPEK